MVSEYCNATQHRYLHQKVFGPIFLVDHFRANQLLARHAAGKSHCSIRTLRRGGDGETPSVVVVVEEGREDFSGVPSTPLFKGDRHLAYSRTS